MYRYAIHVPLLDNDGKSLANLHEDVRFALAQDFEGFTYFTGGGGWQGDRFYHEHVAVYMVDTDELNHADARMIRLANEVKIRARQESVYVTRHTIETRMV